MYKPDNDGIDHINIYSKGKTELGRWLSNFAYSPFTHPIDGKFTSIEGYWYWLLAPQHNPNRERLRRLVGFPAKELGRELGCKDWGNTVEFQDKIKHAIVLKLNTHTPMLEEFLRSTLPLAHYYHYGSKVVNVPQADWLVEFLEDLRKPDEN